MSIHIADVVVSLDEMPRGTREQSDPQQTMVKHALYIQDSVSTQIHVRPASLPTYATEVLRSRWNWCISLSGPFSRLAVTSYSRI